MRKYFLISAVALLTATNVNAQETNFSAQIDMTAKVTEATKLTCSPLNFGHIVLNTDPSDDTVIIKISNVNDVEIINDAGSLIGVSDASTALCDMSVLDTASFVLPVKEKLTGANGKTLSVTDFMYYRLDSELAFGFGATLTLPPTSAGALSGDYTGSFTITAIVEG